MAKTQHSPHFKVYDEYYTPKSAWTNVKKSIPTDKIIWEACMLNAELSESDKYLTELGCKVIADRTMDCLETQPKEWDIIITNIPFDKKKKVPILEKFVEYDKPFMVIMNSMNTFSKYFHRIFKGKEQYLQIITPSSHINFQKEENGVVKQTAKCSFYSVYVCYKLNLPPEQLWIDSKYL
tara:strand:+ start:222 stop:761 length:540 start_codon:yes stop_codon:yes gene_type:complete